MPRDLPESFGRYRILRSLGAGSMGSVHLARDTRLERLVALKVPNLGEDPGGSSDPEVLVRFFREARAAATLHHPNICPVFDVGEVDGIPFLTMAYLEGRPLCSLVESGEPLEQRRAAEIVRTLALAMQEAHRRGVIHRDLKPANIMVTPAGEPVVMDFGLARRDEALEPRLTRSGVVMGTPAYMAPEQIRGELAAVSHGCDIYALGVILYELLTARVPFNGSVMAVLGQILHEEPEPPSRYREGLDRRLEATCLRAMAKEVDERYATMADLVSALDDCLDAVAGPPRAAWRGPSRPATGARPWPLPANLLYPAGACVLLAVLALAHVLRDAGGRAKVYPDDPGAAAGATTLGTTVPGAGPDDPPRSQSGPSQRSATGDGPHPRGPTPVVRRGDDPAAPAGTTSRPAAPSPAPPAPKPADRPATRESRLATAAPPRSTPPPRPAPAAEPGAVVPGRAVRAAPTPSVEPPGTITNSVGMKLSPIPAGEFQMGSPDSDPDAASDERPRHRVRIARPFFLGTYEVTRAQYRGVMGEARSGFEDQPDHPAEQVSWYDAVRFCNALSHREGLKPFYAIVGEAVSVPDWGVPGYRLPTEAEWEYACRAGSGARYGFGEDTASLDEYAWCGVHAGGRSHAVGRKLPNDFGLFDMHGNVWEYCWDGFDAAYYKQSRVDDPIGPPRAPYRVIRGGSWASKPRACLPAVRRPTLPWERNGIQGFRVARTRSNG